MISDVICMPCRETRRARKIAELTGKVGKKIKELRALHGHWSEFANAVMHDEKKAGKAQRALDLLRISIHTLEELQGELNGREPTTTEQLGREEEERDVGDTPRTT